MKKANKLVFIIPIVMLVFIVLAYKYFNADKVRPPISSLSSIDIYKFNSHSKFSNDKIDVINNESKLLKFKVIMNSLDTSDGIKKIKNPKYINIESFEHYSHIKPNFKYTEDNQTHDGSFLLYVFIGNSEDKSYITFSGTELTYILDESNTNILREIFSNTKQSYVD